MIRYTDEKITELKNNEVFVFGSNASGFHGAGSAGMAFRGEGKNNWRDDSSFQEAMRSAPNSPKRIGNWAIYGQARGFQKGHNGMSYAIETIKKPGLKRSTSLEEIEFQLKTLSQFAIDHNDLIFLVTKIGSALAGYTEEEIRSVFVKVSFFPENVILPKEYEFRHP